MIRALNNAGFYQINGVENVDTYTNSMYDILEKQYRVEMYKLGHSCEMLPNLKSVEAKVISFLNRIK